MVQQLTIGGGVNGTSGVISVPSGFSGSSTVPGTINYLLQGYLDALAAGIASAGGGLQNFDIAAGENFTVGASTGILEEFTNTDSVGNTDATAATGSYTVNPNATYVAVQAPGTFSLAGSAGTTFALLGQNSNVTYTVDNASVGSSIFAAGGTDSVTLLDDGTAGHLLDDTVVATGNDTLNFYGKGSVNSTVEAGSSAFVQIDDTNATVDALGSTTVGWVDQNSGGTLYFINGSADTAFIQAGVFAGGQTDKTQVTAFGGVGGGFFIGGQGGGTLPNLLVGGAPGSVTVSSSGVITQNSADSTAGIVTLVGAVNGDILEAQGYSTTSPNAFFAGSGSETLIAASSTGSNLFQLGLNYPGIGEPQSNGVVSTQGSGTQTFFLGNSAGAKLYASTATGANNYFYVVSDATAGGGTFGIYNFVPGQDYVFLTNATENGAGDASVSAIYQDPSTTVTSSSLYATDISLTDGTTIKLYGITASNIAYNQDAPATVNGATIPGIINIY